MEILREENRGAKAVSDVGHNNPPEPTIEEMVLEARQSRDMADVAKQLATAAEEPFLVQAKEASRAHWAEQERYEGIYKGYVARIGKWQEKQRNANPFADPREASRVIIDGEVAVTTRKSDSFEVFKPDLVPRELCKPDEAKIKAALARGEEVPGVQPRTKYITVMR